MNEKDKAIVRRMIQFVEQTERSIKAAKLGTPGKEKTKAVKEIKAELEREIKDADKQN